jgi:hypothetical protein
VHYSRNVENSTAFNDRQQSLQATDHVVFRAAIMHRCCTCCFQISFRVRNAYARLSKSAEKVIFRLFCLKMSVLRLIIRRRTSRERSKWRHLSLHEKQARDSEDSKMDLCARLHFARRVVRDTKKSEVRRLLCR